MADTKVQIKAVPDPSEDIAQSVSATLDGLKNGDLIPANVLAVIARMKAPASNSLQLSEFTNNFYRVNADASVSDLRLPHGNVSYWSSLVSRGLQRFDRIMLVAHDESAMADYLVVQADEKMVCCELLSFHKVQHRSRSQDAHAWLKAGDTLVQKAASGTERGGWVIVRANGVELSQNGIAFPSEETARRFYLDHATNRDTTISQYYPR